MPQESKKTIAELHKEFKAKGINKMIPILAKADRKRAWFFIVLKNPQKLSLLERQLFATEFEVKVEDIDWKDAPVLIA